MAGAMDLLSSGGVSGAADRLSANRTPTGKLGSPSLTIKLRNKFTEYRAENPEAAIQWEEWLNENGYGLGDNDHVYRKDE